jgi:signal transduction histidine kinase
MQNTSLGTIIMVDDDIQSLTGMRDFLLELGYRVKACLSGREALDAMEDQQNDLLMTDLMMPEMDGIALMKKAKEADPLIICIMVTGHASIQTAVEAMKEGAFDYITKPVDWKILKMIISRALEVRKLMKSTEQMRIARDQSRAFARRLAEVQEQERQRMARELHDGFGQDLIALNMNLTSLHDPLTDKKTGKTDQRLTDSIGIVSDMAETIRTIIHDFRPAVLDDFGLLAGIKSLADKFSHHTYLHISVQGDEDMPRLPDFVEITLYRIVQEVLTNVAKHAEAENIFIRLRQSDTGIELEIKDDGVGFNATPSHDPKRIGSWGLLNMRERAEGIGGTLQIESEKGKGTRVIIAMGR